MSASKQLTVLYYNARSILPKLDELQANVLLQKPDIICIVETWLSEDVMDNELLLPDYQVHRLDRNRHGGGIALYTHNSLSCRLLCQGGPHNLEFLALSVTSASVSNKFCICLFYRPPSSPVSIFDNLCTTLQMVNPAQFSTFLLLGDFNVNFLNPQHHLFSHLRDILYSFSLHQVVPSFTHVSPNGNKSLIDLALLSEPSCLQSCTTIPPLLSSDHLGVSLAIKWKTPTKVIGSKPRHIWIYKNADFSKACDLIRATNWNSLLSDNVDLSTENWTSRFLEIMEECIPQQELKKRRNLPWLTKNVMRHVRKRNNMFLRAKRSKNPTHFAKYKKIRNNVTTMLRSAKQRYFNSLTSANSKQFWKTVKLVNKQQETIPVLSQDNINAITDKEKSNMLNSYFSKCWNHSEPPLTDLLESNYEETCPDHLFCTTQEIVQLIKGLDLSKANGPDRISARMLKGTCESIAPSLTNLFNLSIAKGHFPKLWKEARVVPIPKSTTKHSPSGYRPISLLSILSKLLEKHFHSLITDHLNQHHPLSDAQWGFQKGKSTLTALLSATHDWLTQLDQNKEICCVFFDFQKAFDTVSHRRLMEKLKQLNLHPLIVNWLRSYLTKRQQSVVVNGTSSHPTHVISGVPQGSVLGPLLFLIYIDDISTLALSESSKLSLYADDMLLYKTISSTADYAELQQDIDLIYSWSTANLMTFNVSKCKCMLVSRRRNTDCPPINLNLNDHQLENVQTYKYLGLLLSSDLSWTHHIESTCTKARKLLGLLYRQFSNNTDPTVMVKLYLSLVRPHLEYGAQVWHPYTAKDTHTLEKVQQFGLRICTRHWNSSYQDLLDIFQLPSLENRRLFLSLSTFFKIIHNLIYFPVNFHPTPLSSSLRCNHDQQYSIPFAHTNHFKYSFLPNSISVWNNLPLEAVNCTTLPMFKYYTLPLFL